MESSSVGSGTLQANQGGLTLGFRVLNGGNLMCIPPPPTPPPPPPPNTCWLIQLIVVAPLAPPPHPPLQKKTQGPNLLLHNFLKMHCLSASLSCLCARSVAAQSDSDSLRQKKQCYCLLFQKSHSTSLDLVLKTDAALGVLHESGDPIRAFGLGPAIECFRFHWMAKNSTRR